MRRAEAAADRFVAEIAGFGRALRDEGLPVDAGRIADAIAALGELARAAPGDPYWALRHTLVGRREDIEVFDRTFARWFLGGGEAEGPDAHELELPGLAQSDAAAADDPEAPDAIAEATSGWSPRETLLHKDFALLTEEELADLAAAITRLAPARPLRRSRRARPAERGTALDPRRTVRTSLRTGGDALRPVFRERVARPRRLVVLCDVSGSMSAYTRPMLLFAHALLRGGRGVEAFAFGTRLTRLTAELSSRGADDSLARASGRVADWSGGTRIGGSLQTFNDTWGRRGMSRGAVVVIVSDGWERDDAEAVAREMARLSLLAYAVVWVNPLKAQPDYEPLAGGMRAALPHVDRFLAGNNLAGLEELAAVLAGIERRHAA